LQEPKIITVDQKLLVGVSIQTSINESGMPRAWSQLMPKKKEIENSIGSNLYSIQRYDAPNSFKEFTLDTKFTYIAGIEVAAHNQIPSGLEALTLDGGMYAIFTHKGTHAQFRNTTRYIHQEWLPKSKYALDHRNHFEVLGEKYLGQDNPNSEEDVWIPIRSK